ncbi:MAG: hypothetical protein R6V31_08740, partial [Halohasta sp.]
RGRDRGRPHPRKQGCPQPAVRRGASVPRESELLAHLLNPELVCNEVAAFYRDSAEQIIETTQNTEGVRYLTLRKSPTGNVGSTGLLNPLDEPPYVRVEMPAGSHLYDSAE